jgi:hypothetical protein
VTREAYFYNQQGRRILQRKYNKRKLVHEIQIVFDNQGRYIREEYRTKNVWYKNEEIIYNKAGEESKIVWYTKKNKVRAFEEIENKYY